LIALHANELPRGQLHAHGMVEEVASDGGVPAPQKRESAKDSLFKAVVWVLHNRGNPLADGDGSVIDNLKENGEKDRSSRDGRQILGYEKRL